MHIANDMYHVRTYAHTYERTYASSTMSQHSGAETKNTVKLVQRQCGMYPNITCVYSFTNHGIHLHITIAFISTLCNRIKKIVKSLQKIWTSHQLLESVHFIKELSDEVFHNGFVRDHAYHPVHPCRSLLGQRGVSLCVVRACVSMCVQMSVFYVCVCNVCVCVCVCVCASPGKCKRELNEVLSLYWQSPSSYFTYATPQ